MSDGLGAIYPAMMNSIIALRCLGYSVDDPQIDPRHGRVRSPGHRGRETPSACSPASRRCGTRRTRCSPWARAASPRKTRAWSPPPTGCCKKQVTHKGDWSVKNPKGQPGGWYFEFNNEFYPDVDDTAHGVLALGHVDHPNERYQHESVQRAIDWVLLHAVQERRLGVVRQGQRHAWCSSTFPSPTTTPCSIRRRWTSPAACWRCWPRHGYTPGATSGCSAPSSSS